MQGVIVVCAGVLPAFQLHARMDKEDHPQLLERPALSSRWYEYVFQALRALNHTSNVFTALGPTPEVAKPVRSRAGARPKAGPLTRAAKHAQRNVRRSACLACRIASLRLTLNF